MNIKELILAGLQQKFPGVDTAILTRIATKKAEGVTDEEKVNSIVEGISFSDVLTSYGDFRAGDATRTSIQNYEKKHGLKDGKPVIDETKNQNHENEKNEDEEVPKWAKTLIDSNKALSEELTALKNEKLQATRMEQIMSKAKEYGVPEKLAKRYNVPDDADLDAYFKDAAQELKDGGFSNVNPPDSSEQKMEKENESIANMINDGTKKIVEQKN